jgi:hypothetical protein
MVKSAAARTSVQQYRDRMRRAGFRLVQLWVPDTSSDGFAEECRRQSRVAAKKRSVERAAMEWIAANQDTEGWTP